MRQKRGYLNEIRANLADPVAPIWSKNCVFASNFEVTKVFATKVTSQKNPYFFVSSSQVPCKLGLLGIKSGKPLSLLSANFLTF
jgi:hypothetical protein